MPTNWPPATAPSWPPPEMQATSFVTADLLTLVRLLQELGFTHAAPTTAENNAFFKNARCDHGDQVIGRMLISPSGTRYPFAVCNDADHREVLVLWPPYNCGAKSGNYTW